MKKSDSRKARPKTRSLRLKKPSAQFRAERRTSPHNSPHPARQSSAQFKKRPKQSEKRSTHAKFNLTGSGKKRGPKAHIQPSEVANRAYDLRLLLKLAGKQVDWEKLLRAQSVEEVTAVFESMHESYRRKFLDRAELILGCLKDRKFPRQDREAQEQFIADSLAGDGRVSIRRSRDICQQERAREKWQGKILRREFWIVCSCDYEGPAFHDACPKCGALVSYLDFASF